MSLRRFLRHNCRHSLQFSRKQGLKLNPLSWRYASDDRTFGWHESLWLFRLRQRLFCFAGRHKCRGEFAATWDLGPDGNRTCSVCGSIHADDLMKICRKTLVDERYGVEGTCKGYKAYVRQPGVHNAGEGAIKFYMWHAPENPSEDDQKLFADAKHLTWKRFEREMEARWPRKATT